MRRLIEQIVKFGIVGVIATVLDFGMMNLLYYGLGLPVVVANTGGFVVGVIFNYLASMRYVFSHKEGMSRTREFVTFVVLSVIGLLISDGIVWLLAEQVGLEANLSKVFATCVTMVYNFISRKVFLDAGDAPAEAEGDSGEGNAGPAGQ